MQPTYLNTFFAENRHSVNSRIINKQLEAIDYFNRNKIPYFLIENNPDVFGYTTDEIKLKVNDTPYIKTEKNALSNVNLIEKLDDLNVETLGLMGLFATDCILETALNWNKGEVITNKDIIANTRKLGLNYEDKLKMNGINLFYNNKDIFSYLERK